MKGRVASRWWARYLPWIMVVVIALLVTRGFAKLASETADQTAGKTPTSGNHSTEQPTQAQTDALKAQIAADAAEARRLHALKR